MPVAHNAEPGPLGRPRRDGLDHAILDATLAEMARAGYPRMSVEAVARQAGTTKPTVYARFPSKAALATAALESLRQSTPRHLTGDVRHDLIEVTMLVGSLHAAAIAGRPPGKDWPGRVVDAWLRQDERTQHPETK
jgi:AcrR family transcriptional regulator